LTALVGVAGVGWFEQTVGWVVIFGQFLESSVTPLLVLRQRLPFVTSYPRVMAAAITGLRGIVQPGGPNSPLFEQYVSVAYESEGAGAAGKIPILNENGQLDASMVPAFGGTDVDCGEF